MKQPRALKKGLIPRAAEAHVRPRFIHASPAPNGDAGLAWTAHPTTATQNMSDAESWSGGRRGNRGGRRRGRRGGARGRRDRRRQRGEDFVPIGVPVRDPFF